ncbi:hypothetical protein [Flavobacterium marginilacus]|uniref:hypothetical protein n=1 Tax=Flavobacterium marginilacus TaxID=3003256 RepID=UPI00248EAE18|nr:hypothetical protein [Flavobacterium marginilacus]
MKRLVKSIVLSASFICSISNAQSNSKKEKFTINWPKDEGWHIVDQQDDVRGMLTGIRFLKGKEFIGNSSEMVATDICRDSLYVPLSRVEAFYPPLKNIPATKRTIIERDDKAQYPWFILKIEHVSESQIWYVIQGKNELFCNVWLTQQKEITPESQEKWVKVFKSSKIMLE